MKVVKVQNKTTKEVAIAVYAPNKKGNKQFNINNVFYSDRKFDKHFEIITNEQPI